MPQSDERISRSDRNVLEREAREFGHFVRRLDLQGVVIDDADPDSFPVICLPTASRSIAPELFISNVITSAST